MVEWRLGCRAVGVLRLIILALSARRVRSAVTCAPNPVHSALLPARRRGSTRDGRRTDDTGVKHGKGSHFSTNCVQYFQAS